MASKSENKDTTDSNSGFAKRTWEWMRGKKTQPNNTSHGQHSNSKANRMKSKSTDASASDEDLKGRASKLEVEKEEPDRPASPFTAVSMDDHLVPSSRERIQAPTHVAAESTLRPPKFDKSKEKRRSLRLSNQPVGTLAYTVRTDDSLPGIAARFETTTSELKKLNKLMSTMVWPGQTLYVPDQSYVPSTPTSSDPSTPQFSLAPGASGPGSPPFATRSPPLSPGTVTEFGRQAPGLAQPVTKRKHKSGDPNTPHVDSRSTSGARQDSPKSEDPVTVRFVKVKTKHITDGQGVVSGTLLVTPNAVMFDPNVSDRLVLEHGADSYSLMANMDDILSVAMFKDIAAMRLQTQPQDALKERPKAYHSEDCPLFHQPQQTPSLSTTENQSLDTNTPDLIKDIPDAPVSTGTGSKDSRNRNESVCSCGKDSTGSYPISDLELSHHSDKSTQHKHSADVTHEIHIASATGTAHNSSTATQAVGGSNESKGGSPRKTVTSSDQVPSNEMKSSVDMSPSDPRKVSVETASTGKENTGDSSSKSDKDIKEPTALASDMAQLHLHTSRSAANTSSAKLPTIPEPDAMEFHSQQERPHFYLNDGNDENAAASVEGGATPAYSTPLLTAVCSQPQNIPDTSKGILSRTIGSLGSFSSTPGFSALVDYSSGLFTRKDSKVKDIHDLPMSEVPGGSQSGSSIFDSDVPQTTNESIDKVYVKSAVSIEDRPELFRSIYALIPRPAAQYEDPPLFLCIRLRKHKYRRSAAAMTGAADSKQYKPEYWFSIPKEKVDQLYAFFVQWSPSLYDNDDEETTEGGEGQGFVIVDGDGLDDVVMDHFKLSQSWKIIHMDAWRQESELDLVIEPELLDDSSILSSEHVIKLGENLPARAEGYPWSLRYSSNKHGISLKTLYRKMKNVDSPVLLIVQDSDDQVFGAMLSCGPAISDHFIGSGETYLFTFYEQFRIFRWTGANNFYMKGNKESLAIGASQGTYGLWLDGDLYHGRSHFCDTFGNEVLTKKEDFIIKTVEAWIFES